MHTLTTVTDNVNANEMLDYNAADFDAGSNGIALKWDFFLTMPQN